MALKALHDNLEEIPDQYRELYTEKAGRWELTGIDGIFTQANLERLQVSLNKERELHKQTKEKLAIWDGYDKDEIDQKIESIPALEIAAQGNLEEAQVEEIVARRVQATIDSKTTPLERQVKSLTATNQTLKEERDTLFEASQVRKIHDVVREAMIKQKVLPEAHEDVLIHAERIFEINEDEGLPKVLAKDQVGVTPGITPETWLNEIQAVKKYWWPQSQGSGAPGAGGKDKLEGPNPFAADTRNFTEQARLMREDPELAKAYADAAGVSI